MANEWGKDDEIVDAGWGNDDFVSASWGADDEVVEPVELDAVDKAGAFAATFTEGMAGIGDELAGFGQELGGTVYDIFNTDKSIGQALKDFSIDRGIDAQRAKMDAFDAMHPGASLAATAAGIGTSMLVIPGATASAVARGTTTAGRVGLGAAAGAAEGGLYGYLSGRDEGRAESAAMGAAIGGTIGAGVSLLLRNTDDVARMMEEDRLVHKADDATHIGGTDGFVDAGYTGRKSTKAADTSLQDTTQEQIRPRPEGYVDKVLKPKKTSNLYDSIVDDAKGWTEKFVGTRAARLLQDSEWAAKTGIGELRTRVALELEGLDDMFKSRPDVHQIYQKMGRKESLATWDDLIEKVGDDPAFVGKLQKMKSILDDAKTMDVIKTVDEYTPTMRKQDLGGAEFKGFLDQYEDPTVALMNYFDEVIPANAILDRFGIPIERVMDVKGTSRVEHAIKLVKKEAMKQGASEEVARNLADVLKSVHVDARRGAHAAGAVLRKATNATMLANPSNAILNVSDLFTPMYQNGVRATIKPLARGLKNIVTDTLNEYTHLFGYGRTAAHNRSLLKSLSDENWASANRMGFGDQYMGEVAADAVKTVSDKLSGFRFAVPAKVGEKVDDVANDLYGKFGVKAVNKAGQEIQLNAARNRGMALAHKAAKGDKKADKLLREHDGMRGLSEVEYLKTRDALMKGDIKDPWVRNYLGAALDKWHPVSHTAMPKALADNPNGRILYSMLTYLNKIHNGMRRELGDAGGQVLKYGINTKEGQAALGNFTKKTAGLVALYGTLPGLLYQGRYALDASRDDTLDELLTPEGLSEATIAQLVSVMSVGMVDPMYQKYDGNPVFPVTAPQSYLQNVGKGVTSLGTGMMTGEASDLNDFYRMLNSSVPGLSNINKTQRMITGENMFDQQQ